MGNASSSKALATTFRTVGMAAHDFKDKHNE
jgi:hypothetical protein